jgi:hypothetical protein
LHSTCWDTQAAEPEEEDDAAAASGAAAAPRAAAPVRARSDDAFMERCKYVPLRLSLDDRKQMRLLEATMNVSEYTDKIDIYSAEQKSKRIMAQLREVHMGDAWSPACVCESVNRE